MEKQPSNNSTPTPEVTGGVDHSLDDLFESTSSSRQTESDSSDLWDLPSTSSRPAETIDTASVWDETSTSSRPAETTDSVWGDSVEPTTPSQELAGVDPFSSEQFASPGSVEEAGGGLIQRIRKAASRETLDSALERVTEVASALGGMAVEASVSAAGVVKAKAGEAVEATKEFVMDEGNQETAKRIGATIVKNAVEGGLGETGLGVLNSEGKVNKVKAARVVLKAVGNPGGTAAKVGKGIFLNARKQATALGIDLAKNRLT